jgi:hypothetical protein
MRKSPAQENPQGFRKFVPNSKNSAENKRSSCCNLSDNSYKKKERNKRKSCSVAREVNKIGKKRLMRGRKDLQRNATKDLFDEKLYDKPGLLRFV